MWLCRLLSFTFLFRSIVFCICWRNMAGASSCTVRVRDTMCSLCATMMRGVQCIRVTLEIKKNGHCSMFRHCYLAPSYPSSHCRRSNDDASLPSSARTSLRRTYLILEPSSFRHSPNVRPLSCSSSHLTALVPSTSSTHPNWVLPINQFKSTRRPLTSCGNRLTSSASSMLRYSSNLTIPHSHETSCSCKSTSRVLSALC